MAETREGARADLIDRWDRDRAELPGASRIILTHTNDEVRELNLAARERLRAARELGSDVSVTTERGRREFATGDRVMFLRNERGLGVKNGTLGVVQSATPARMAVLLDDGRPVAFDVKDYSSIDHGYAATIHKAQGVTVDRVHVLATPGLDRHAAYVAMSRHRDSVDLHYGQDDFADQRALTRALSRDRGKDMAFDYTASEPPQRRPKVPSQFAGLKLNTSPIVTPEQDPLEQAVVRVARAAADILRTRKDGQGAGAAAAPGLRASACRDRVGGDTPWRPGGSEERVQRKPGAGRSSGTGPTTGGDPCDGARS